MFSVRILIASSIGLQLAASLAIGQTSQSDERPTVYDVQVDLSVDGTLTTRTDADEFIRLPLHGRTSLEYRERHVAAAHRSADQWRSVRHYRSGESKIKVGNRETTLTLDRAHELLATQATPGGVLIYDSDRALAFDQRDLLEVPADSLIAPALLPQPGHDWTKSWEIPAWVAQALVRVDVAATSRLTCRVVDRTKQYVRAAFEGETVGATRGSATQIHVRGWFHFNPTSRRVGELAWTQEEKRSATSLSPGIDVRAEVKMIVRPIGDEGRLHALTAGRVPTVPSPEHLELQHELPIGWRVQMSRDWIRHHNSSRVVTFRQISKGEMNVQWIVAGLKESMDEVQFRDYVRTSLGTKLSIISEQEDIPHNDGQLIRFVADGESAGRTMKWIYYLLTTSDGNQLSASFALEADRVTGFKGADVALMQSVARQNR